MVDLTDETAAGLLFLCFFKFLDVNFSKPPAENDPTHSAPFQAWLQEGLYQCLLRSFKKSNSDPFILVLCEDG